MMMIYWMGVPSEINSILHHAEGGDPFTFKHVEDLSTIPPIDQAELFLILPSVRNPVKIVSEIATKDKLLSIIVLAEPARYNRLREAIQFALFVGKSTTCLSFNPSHSYHAVFLNAIRRTRQKRTFHKFKFGTQAKLSELTAPAVRLDSLGNILEQAPIGAMLLNLDLTVIGANKASREMFAALNEVQIHLSSLFRDNDFESVAKKIKEGDQSLLSVDDVNGRYFEVSVVRYRQETLDQIILLVSDVTERRLKDKRIEDVIESLPLISWTANPQGEITFFSRGWYEYTNLSPSQALGVQWMSVVHEDDRRQLLSRWEESVKHGKRYQQAARLKRFDGHYRWHLSRSVPIYATNGEILLWVGTSTDIHEHVLLTETLERKVHERTKRLEEKNAELEQFAYISSHDLQEPLRKIQTFAHILKDNDEDVSKEAKDRYIDKIISTSARMSKLIKDLLNFTKIDQMEKEEVLDLNSIMHQIIEDLELAIHQHSALVEVDQLPVIEGRPLQIKQLFYNIINNGLKFRKPDVTPRVSISSKNLPREELSKFPHLSPERVYHEIVVADNGIGFEQKYADQIFTVFQRLHNKSAYEGTGIGLAIARKVASNHGGYIFAVSSPGEGSEFHVLLPAIVEPTF